MKPFLTAAFLIAATLVPTWAAAPVLNMTLATSGAIVKGQQVKINVNLSQSAGNNLAAIETDLSLPPGLTSVSIAAGVAGVGKTVTCSLATGICLLIGPNQTVINDGVVFVITATVGTTGPESVAFTSAISANASAAGVATIMGGPLAFTVGGGPCDLNSDGLINQSDLDLVTQAVVNSSTNTGLYDLTLDGKIDTIDAQRIANAVAGGACVTGP